MLTAFDAVISVGLEVVTIAVDVRVQDEKLVHGKLVFCGQREASVVVELHVASVCCVAAIDLAGLGVAITEQRANGDGKAYERGRGQRTAARAARASNDGGQ